MTATPEKPLTRETVLAALEAAVEPFAMRRATPSDIPALTALAHRLLVAETLTGDMATLDDIQRVESWSERTLYVRERDGACVGFIALVFLTKEGNAALRAGAVDAHIRERRWVAGVTDKAYGALLWSMGGETGADQVAVVRALLAIWSQTVPEIPGYSRAGTRHGLRLMVRLGFEEVVAVPGRAALWGRDGAPRAVMGQRAYRRTREGAADRPGAAA